MHQYILTTFDKILLYMGGQTFLQEFYCAYTRRD